MTYHKNKNIVLNHFLTAQTEKRRGSSPVWTKWVCWVLQQIEKPERLSQEIPQWGEFYSRLRSLKDYHRKYPNEVSSTAGWETWKIITGNTPMRWILQQVEKPERLSQEIPQWSEFYSRVRSLKDYHRKYPNEVSSTAGWEAWKIINRKYPNEVSSTAGWEAWKIITGNTPMKWVLQ